MMRSRTPMNVSQPISGSEGPRSLPGAPAADVEDVPRRDAQVDGEDAGKRAVVPVAASERRRKEAVLVAAPCPVGVRVAPHVIEVVDEPWRPSGGRLGFSQRRRGATDSDSEILDGRATKPGVRPFIEVPDVVVGVRPG